MRPHKRHEILSVNPFRCCMWALSDRLESDITEDTCRAEVDSFSKNGQLVPVLGRPLRGNPSYDVELIYGARRLFAARYLKQPLQVELRELSDRDAIISMDIENRQRTDISAYERGLSYARWLTEGHFETQDDIAKALSISPSRVSRLLKIAGLPGVIVEAFGHAAEIREEWGLEIARALEDPDGRQIIMRRARVISAGATLPRPQEVYRQLLAAPCGRGKTVSRPTDSVISDENGRPLFRIRQGEGTVTMLLPFTQTSTETLDAVREAITGILERNRQGRQ